MHKTYQTQSLEQERLLQWAPPSYFSPKGSGEPYCIMLPPPNVTGSLHMGHGFQISIIDALVRYHRMLGHNVLWQGGTDHAGIATQMVVERQLEAKGKHRDQLGREEFLDILSEWKDQSEHRINEQLKRLGASIDFSRHRFTRDAHFNQAVIEVFIRLYEAGLLYKGQRLVNWDPQLETAISDIEVVHTEETGSLYYLRYPLVKAVGHIVVATTRPETLFGDVAIAVHPEDSRYKDLIGQLVQLPLTQRTIPVIADKQVDPMFGTGCVKITPAHDFNDYKIGQRHELPIINLLTTKARLNETVPLVYRGMDCTTARQAVVDALQALGCIDREEPHTLKVPRGERSGVVIEPYLTDQWFMRMQPLAEKAIQAIHQGEVRFVPENWTSVCLQWLENIEDWCISRQLWWGHRIPAWYGPEGELFVGADEASIRRQYNLDENVLLRQEEDVLDTWVSAALWPFVTLGWPDASVDLKTFYPTQVLVTGFDLIFFWVARMLMLGLYFTKQVPFKTVYFTGLIRDTLGQKMSKSKGNVLDPVDIIEGIDLGTLVAKRTRGLMQPGMAQSIEKATRQQFPNGIEAFGADALRLTYYSLAAPTRDIRFDSNRTAGYRNFCNKLWQATRFVIAQHEKVVDTSLLVFEDTSLFDRWILSRLQHTIQTAHQCFATYRFDHLSQAIYEFFWHDYCDWYLEFTKMTLKSENEKNVAATRGTLIWVLQNILRLLHPLTPFITETLWYEIKAFLGTPHSDNLNEVVYPHVVPQYCDAEAEQSIERLQAIVRAIRGLRSELRISVGKQVALIYRGGNTTENETITSYCAMIENLTQVNIIHESNAAKRKDTRLDVKQSAMVSVGSLELFIPLKDAINREGEMQRLQKMQTQLENALTDINSRLSDVNFLEKAPAKIIESTRHRLSDHETQLAVIRAQLSVLH